MKNFDIHRISNVARWDLNTNRKTYTKYALSVIAMYVVIAMYSYVVDYLGARNDNVRASFHEGYGDIYFAAGIAAFMATAFSLQTLLFMSAMFHNLRTRQGRINELMLPATNIEKFAWHVFLIVVANWSLMLVGVLVADALHCLFLMTVYGTSVPLASITASVFDNLVTMQSLDYDTYVSWIGLLGFLFFGHAFVATFALGSAWKYRRSLATTMLFHVFFWLSVIMLFMVVVTVSSVLHLPAPDFIMFLKDMGTSFWAFLFMLLSICTFCGVWYLTYRLYCNAQITTHRNP